MQTERKAATNAVIVPQGTAPRRDPSGNPIGEPLPDWTPRDRPPRTTMEGRCCTLEALDPARHLEDLWRAVSEDTRGSMWTYLAYGPFASITAYREWMTSSCLADDPLFFTIVERASGRATGLASFLRIAPAVGTLEIGHLQFSPSLQRTTAATEALFLMMRRAFSELGYRRCEWKCDHLNGPSRRAAERLGFRFEGLFRQAAVYKAAIAIPRGTRCSIRSGRRSRPRSRPGSIRATSTIEAASGGRWRACGLASRAARDVHAPRGGTPRRSPRRRPRWCARS